MTKHSPRKRAIRAYMDAHQVNYTTAARALTQADLTGPPTPDGSGWRHCRWLDPHPPVVAEGSFVPCVRATGKPGAACATCGEALTVTGPSGQLAALQEALRTGDQEIVHATMRTTAPGPDPWDLAYALSSLARDTATMSLFATRTHTPVPTDVVSLAVTAEATHGHHVGTRTGQSAADICRAALLALDPANPSTSARALAEILGALAQDQATLSVHAAPCNVDGYYLAESLVLLASELAVTPPTLPDAAGLRKGRSRHHLVVTVDPLTDDDRARMSEEEQIDYLNGPDRTYSIGCPGVEKAGCGDYVPCKECVVEWDLLGAQTLRHGVEHRWVENRLMVPTGVCSLGEYPDAWMDYATELSLPAGRYAVDWYWDGEAGCVLTLGGSPTPRA